MAKKKKTPAKKRKTTKKQKRAPFKFMLKWGFVLALWGTMIIVAICAYYATELPAITQNAGFERKSSIIVKAENGNIVGRYGDIVGTKITVEDIPPHLIHAVLATEDRRFYYHFGIDPLGITRAMFVNARKQRFAQGGSTITQQLAKNLFLSRERTLKRKIQEAMLALWLEYELSKDEILEAYLNRVYLGAGTYGVDAASRLYFKKPIQEINIRESATLAGLLKAPSRYSPLNNPNLARERTNVVLNAMIDAGYLDESQKSNIGSALPKPTRKPTGNAERYYTDWIVDQIDELLGAQTEDIIVETTMNPDVQALAEDALASTIRTHGEENKFSQGSVIVMRPNGAVVALIGGKDYAESQFNRATQAKRQPGSAFKPFTYLAALEHGWKPEDTLIDEPIIKGRYRPKNFGNKYYGEINIVSAMTLSLNTIAYQLIKDVGPAAVIDVARHLGITSELNEDLSLALGTNIISPLELTGAYASIANGGITVEPYGITRITSKDGTVYYQRPTKQKKSRKVSYFAISNLTAMMQSVIDNGTGRGAAIGVPASGKTGTSQDSRDAWFIGFTDRLVTSVWLGNDDNTPMKRVTGGSYPARIWRSVMQQSNAKYAPFRYKAPFLSGFQDLLFRLGGTSNKQQEQEQQQNRVSHNDRNNTSSVPESNRYNQ